MWSFCPFSIKTIVIFFYKSPVSLTVCGKILEDTIRVTVDRVNDPTASTGLFEMIYEKDFNCINDDTAPNIETSAEVQLLQNDTVPAEEEKDKTAEPSNSLIINDETLLFEQSIQTYNDKIIEVSC